MRTGWLPWPCCCLAQDEKATGGPGPEDRPVTVEPELGHFEHLGYCGNAGVESSGGKLQKAKCSSDVFRGVRTLISCCLCATATWQVVLHRILGYRWRQHPETSTFWT